MKKIIILIIAVVALSAVSAAYWFSMPDWKKIKEEPKIPCGPTNCHGFDVQCGEPVQCELVYQFGDNCRRFSKCSVVNGTCQVVREQRFEQCLACVMGCAPLLEYNYLGAMECEYRCTL